MKTSRIIAAAVALTLVGGTYISEAPRQLNTEITACAAETYGYFEYNRYSDHIELTRYTGNEAEVTIPSEIDGLPVTALSGYSGNGTYGVFEDKYIVSVEIPDTFTSIGSHAFNSCSKLLAIKISENVTNIGDSAFYGCTSLTSVNIPDSVETLGSSAFSGCDNLHTVRLGADTVGAYAFSGDDKLTNITISDNVKSIGSYAFSGCTKLEKITFPDSVKDMGEAVFYGCSSLSEVTLPNEITALSSDGRQGFFGECTSLKSIVIPYYVTSIGENAFSNAPLESITIGARLSSLDNIPLDLSSLKEIKVADENRSYSSEEGILFNKDKSALIRYPRAKEEDEYFVPDTVISLNNGSFEGDLNLKKLTIPQNVEKIGASALNNCSRLEDVYIMNPKCEIYDTAATISDDIYINGYSASTAESYAIKYNKHFTSIGDTPQVTTTSDTTSSDNTATTTVTTSVPADTYHLGDVNSDGMIDARDATEVLTEYAKASTGLTGAFSFNQKIAADVNKDGMVDARDATLILTYYAYSSTGHTVSFEEYLK